MDGWQGSGEWRVNSFILTLLANRHSPLRGGQPCIAIATEEPGRGATPRDEVAAARRRIRVALGQEPGDLLIAGGQVVNVFTAASSRPTSSSPTAGSPASDATSGGRDRTISAAGQVVVPGLIDAHMHLESTLLTPAELARLIVPMGTTADDLRLARGGQRAGHPRDRHAGRGQRGAAAGPVLHGLVLRARDALGRRRRGARARGGPRAAGAGPACWAWPR